MSGAALLSCNSPITLRSPRTRDGSRGSCCEARWRLFGVERCKVRRQRCSHPMDLVDFGRGGRGGVTFEMANSHRDEWPERLRVDRTLPDGQYQRAGALPGPANGVPQLLSAWHSFRRYRTRAQTQQVLFQFARECV